MNKPEQTDERLHDHLVQSGYQQSKSDPNNYWKPNANGGVTDIDTDGQHSQVRGSGQWKKDENNRTY